MDDSRVTIVTEAGSPSVQEEVALRLRDGLRAEKAGAFQSRALSAAEVIDAALDSDHRVRLAHHQQLAVLDVVNKWEPLEDPEVIALAAALRQAPSLTHEYGAAPGEDPLDRLPRLD